MSEVNFDFSGKNFAVMGASSGIGKQIALDLLDSGANVLAMARRKELMDEIFAKYSSQVITAKVDVCHQENLDEILKSFVKTKGKLHGSVYTTGITSSFDLRMFEEEELTRIMEVNFFGAVKFLSKLTKTIYVNSGSSNVWLASTAAHAGARGLSAYSASKGAMISSMKSFALEIGNKKHRLNSISPGWIRTSMTENFTENTGLEERYGSGRYILENYGQPEDVSGIALFLLSNKSRWITGIDIVVDGGYLAS